METKIICDGRGGQEVVFETLLDDNTLFITKISQSWDSVSIIGKHLSSERLTYDDVTDKAKEFWKEYLIDEDEGACKQETNGNRVMCTWANGETAIYDSVDDAVDYILRTDWDHHGMDVVLCSDGYYREYISCGQCYEALPDDAQKVWKKYHLQKGSEREAYFQMFLALNGKEIDNL